MKIPEIKHQMSETLKLINAFEKVNDRSATQGEQSMLYKIAKHNIGHERGECVPLT